MARVEPTDERPLDGRTIVVTRAAAQARRFSQLLEAAGARVLEAPAIVIAPPPSWERLDSALAALETFTWVIFTSVNGVAMVDRRLAARGLTWAATCGRRVAAIGPATADALAEQGVRSDVVPGEYRAEGLVERLRAVMTSADRVLLPRAAQTRDVLVTELRRLGVHVEEVAAYTTRRAEAVTARLREALAAGSIDAVTFTASSTARNFAELFSEEERRAWLGRVTGGLHRPDHRGHRRRVWDDHRRHAGRVHDSRPGDGCDRLFRPRAARWHAAIPERVRLRGPGR